MRYIYRPSGRAGEYSPFALNVYDGCNHGCKYCYCPSVMRGQWSDEPTPRRFDWALLRKDAEAADSQILMSFAGDPYCGAEAKTRHTRRVLELLAAERCSVAVLTKGRCLGDLDIFESWPGHRIMVGVTLTFSRQRYSAMYEPGATSPLDRITTLESLQAAGVTTWASIEPVVIPSESLNVLEDSIEYLNRVAVGKLNHNRKAELAIDWRLFGMEAVNICRAAGVPVYVKHDLQKFMPDGYLNRFECDPATIWVKDRS